MFFGCAYEKMFWTNPTSYTHAIICSCPLCLLWPCIHAIYMYVHVHAHKPHIPSLCPHEHFKKKKMKFIFFLIGLSYFVLLHMSCHHLGSMPVTSPKFSHYYYPPCEFIVPYLSTFVSSFSSHMFALGRSLRHVALFLWDFFIVFIHWQNRWGDSLTITTSSIIYKVTCPDNITL